MFSPQTGNPTQLMEDAFYNSNKDREETYLYHTHSHTMALSKI